VLAFAAATPRGKSSRPKRTSSSSERTTCGGSKPCRNGQSGYVTSLAVNAFVAGRIDLMIGV
jgi:hypothetical protein